MVNLAAEKFQEKNITILNAIFKDKTNCYFAKAYNNLSTIYQSLGGLLTAKNLGHLLTALSFQNDSIYIKEKIYNKNHSSLAISYKVLAVIYFEMSESNINTENSWEKLTLAKKYIDQSVNIFRSWQIFHFIKGSI